MILKLQRRINLKIKDTLYRLGINIKKDTLVYLGMNKGMGFDQIFRDYKVCYGFEADPELFQVLDKKYKKYKNVTIINAVVTEKDGFVDFNISSNNGLSSSVGKFKEEWVKSTDIKITKTVSLPSINLYNFLSKRNIDTIDDYISDIQGYDLKVLSTLKTLIEQKKIKRISSEVAKDEKENIYEGLPLNNLSAFNDLLSDNYKLVAKGEGILKEGEFNEVPEGWWEMDCMWKVKN
jgi:FkbM family methyltransferase